jgi:hypothetical protein
MSRYTETRPIAQHNEYHLMAKKPKSRATTSGFHVMNKFIGLGIKD